MDLIIQPCTDLYFEAVKSLIREFELDDRALKQDEFLIALHNNTLAGFGRVREHAGCSEMCSLGIVTSLRSKGIGKKLVMALAQKAEQELYLVCIIPAYFEEFGFYTSTAYPEVIQDKLEYCVGSLPVDEVYVVMKRR